MAVHRSCPLLLVAIAFLLSCVLYYPHMWDNDIWFILSTGRSIVQDGFFTVDPLTLHQGLSYLPQQWLSAVLDWSVYSMVGQGGLVFLYYLFAAVLVILFFRLGLLVINGPRIVPAIITALFTFFILSFVNVRPHVFDFIVIVSTALLLEKYTIQGNIRWLIPLPIIEVVEMNLHMTMWPLMFIVGAGYFLFVPKKYPYRRTPLLICGCVCLISCFVNPYGLDGVTFVMRSLAVDLSTANIIELQPASLENSYGKQFFLLLFAMAVFIRYKKPNVPARWLAILMVFIGMALATSRSIPLFYLACFVVMLFAFADGHTLFLDKVNARIQTQKTKRMVKGALGTFLAVGSLAVLAAGIHGISQYPDRAEKSRQETAIWLAENAPIGSKVYTCFNDGGLLEFYGFKAYIDPRAELFYKEMNGQKDIMSEWWAMKSGELDFNDLVAEYDFDYIFVNGISDSSLYYGLYISPEYTLIYDDYCCSIYMSVEKAEQSGYRAIPKTDVLPEALSATA
ncbi:hypothetical protein NE582_02360 [Gordonibacter pamelaeae]|uniref:hypothetical protein n=1 Tax=Gordonibacter pamelaeae TaxID=471189 RepID=UPI0012B0831A|nr:hypothetical protein [Gordonibacter pamelaeae]MCQ4846058.1 hypothetical protein [Gordonibacter pamelaeae]MSA60550.1 hypothetical protein [Gordonibacter pamelaeae]